MIEIDGKKFNARWEYGTYTQTAEIMNGSNAGRMQNTASMYLDPIGTFFNSKGTILKRNCTDEEWDELYRILSDPMGEHMVKVPFDQGYLETKIYISTVVRTLLKQTKSGNIWGNSYSVTYTAMDSQWLAGGELEGYTEGV